MSLLSRCAQGLSQASAKAQAAAPRDGRFMDSSPSKPATMAVTAQHIRPLVADSSSHGLTCRRDQAQAHLTLMGGEGDHLPSRSTSPAALLYPLGTSRHLPRAAGLCGAPWRSLWVP